MERLDMVVYAAQRGLGIPDDVMLRANASTASALRKGLAQILPVVDGVPGAKAEVLRNAAMQPWSLDGGQGDPITMPPAGDERFLLSVDAPVLDSAWPHGWGISLHRWVDDEFNEEGDPVGSESEEVLYCALKERPLLVDVVRLLDQAGDRMPDWAHTPQGETLAGTEFVVTRRPGS